MKYWIIGLAFLLLTSLVFNVTMALELDRAVSSTLAAEQRLYEQCQEYLRKAADLKQQNEDLKVLNQTLADQKQTVIKTYIMQQPFYGWEPQLYKGPFHER